MRTLAVCVTALALASSASAQDPCGQREPAPGILVSAEWLKRHLNDSGLVVLQVERSRATYDSAHVAGARFVALSEYTIKRGDLLTELPPLEHLDSLFTSLGVEAGGRIVVYGETLPVTRLFFTLDYAGLGARVSLLDGGLSAWRQASGAITSVPTSLPAKHAAVLKSEPARLADGAWVEQHRRDPRVLLLDARTKEEFDGSVTEDGVARPGHIPGARNLEWTTVLQDGRFKDAAELRRIFAAAGASPNRELVVYCRVGSRATALYVAARILRYPVRLYDGSMNDWASLAVRPVVKKRSMPRTEPVEEFAFPRRQTPDP